MSAKLRQALRGLASARGLNGEVFEELFGLASGIIEGAEHRALAIVGGALLEDALRNAIAEHLNPKRKPESDIRLFEDEFAPLQSLGARIRLASSLGIIDDKTTSDLNFIRLIRIAFAHTPTRISFANETVLNALNSLNALKFLSGEALDELKMIAHFDYDGARFAVAVSLLCGALSLNVPFWHPERRLARALKAASLNRSIRPSRPDQETPSENQ